MKTTKAQARRNRIKDLLTLEENLNISCNAFAKKYCKEFSVSAGTILRDLKLADYRPYSTAPAAKPTSDYLVPQVINVDLMLDILQGRLETAKAHFDATVENARLAYDAERLALERTIRDLTKANDAEALRAAQVAEIQAQRQAELEHEAQRCAALREQHRLDVEQALELEKAERQARIESIKELKPEVDDKELAFMLAQPKAADLLAYERANEVKPDIESEEANVRELLRVQGIGEQNLEIMKRDRTDISRFVLAALELKSKGLTNNNLYKKLLIKSKRVVDHTTRRTQVLVTPWTLGQAHNQRFGPRDVLTALRDLIYCSNRNSSLAKAANRPMPYYGKEARLTTISGYHEKQYLADVYDLVIQSEGSEYQDGYAVESEEFMDAYDMLISSRHTHGIQLHEVEDLLDMPEQY